MLALDSCWQEGVLLSCEGMAMREAMLLLVQGWRVVRHTQF
jgi:hypothetical protein